VSDTIAAVATAPGRSAVAVVRISGSLTRSALQALGAGRIRPRRASLRTLKDLSGAPIDRGLVLWFPAPASYTGEDCAELHVHGGRAVVERMLGALLDHGLRLAEPGEFTRRAFEHGKLDLAQAEAVADLVDAESEAQASQALAQLGGALSRRHEHWRALLLDALARLEAAVDFPDEDIDPALGSAAIALREIGVDLAAALMESGRGRAVREGYRVALIGAPNAGKSTLLNALVGRDMAIVTAHPGTTRDVIEAPVVMGGYRVIFADMAGLRPSDDPIEAEGVRRALAWAREADLRIWVVDAFDPGPDWRAAEPLVREGDVMALNKADLLSAELSEEGEFVVSEGGAVAEKPERVISTAAQVVQIRCAAAAGDVGQLRAWLGKRAAAELASGEFPAATRQRHVIALDGAARHVAMALADMQSPELAAENVRLAIRALARVTGEVDPEAVLDRVFSSFCIGK
jgi:tRNA modification GTPase